jgi:hypothetical protein
MELKRLARRAACRNRGSASSRRTTTPADGAPGGSISKWHAGSRREEWGGESRTATWVVLLVRWAWVAGEHRVGTAGLRRSSAALGRAHGQGGAQTARGEGRGAGPATQPRSRTCAWFFSFFLLYIYIYEYIYIPNL